MFLFLTSCQFTNEPNREISRSVFQNLEASVSSSPLPVPLQPFFCFRSNFRAITRLETLATQANDFRGPVTYPISTGVIHAVWTILFSLHTSTKLVCLASLTVTRAWTSSMSFCFSSSSKFMYHFASLVLPARFWIKMNRICKATDMQWWHKVFKLQ